jgi:hypothetical protein
MELYVSESTFKESFAFEFGAHIFINNKSAYVNYFDGIKIQIEI